MIDRNLHLLLTRINRINSIMKGDHLNYMFDCLVLLFHAVTDLFPNIFYLAADITDQGALDLAVLFDHGLLRDAASKIK